VIWPAGAGHECVWRLVTVMGRNADSAGCLAGLESSYRVSQVRDNQVDGTRRATEVALLGQSISSCISTGCFLMKSRVGCGILRCLIR
jgi:hypothetical protein